MRIAHLSDPHFSKATYDPRQFLSKRWIGNFNFILNRRASYQTEHLWSLPELIGSLKASAVCITGDFSTTSLDEEFSEGRRFIYAFKEQGFRPLTLPGNHDCYTKQVQKQQRFYSFFPSEGLSDKKVEKILLGQGWWYVGLDCAVATPYFCSYGIFFEHTEKILEKTLSSIPSSDRVILCNHFPLFTANRPLHDLKKAEALQALLKSFPQVKLYLHGHDHAHYIIDRQSEGFPLVINSGSCAHKPGGTFCLIDLFETSCLVQRLFYREENKTYSWVVEWQKHYELRI